jgi:hypothetical protein
MLHFSLFEGLAASVDNAGGFVLMVGVVANTALFLGLWLVSVCINLNHNDVGMAVIALFPIFTVGNTAFNHRILHIDHLIFYYHKQTGPET